MVTFQDIQDILIEFNGLLILNNYCKNPIQKDQKQSVFFHKFACKQLNSKKYATKILISRQFTGNA